ncbi:MAG TPA: V-type ATP synthase subunit F [Sedimentisphaerales bacterium]|nr:V-type ATP synthase subunit F [Sedimentisphaerales bacterium]HRS09819.1 V-type ATP synthase subunit F [Sedimentisphaerales bacterium]HRV46531.1 V-type ATP synthase subunit F [Sedimentisphaerales bacterium]
MEGKVAVLGDADFVMPFRALGADTFAVEQQAEQVVAAAEKIVDAGYALVVVAENVAPQADAAFAPTESKPTPCVVVVPFTTASEGFATEALGKVLKLATGINILQHN